MAAVFNIGGYQSRSPRAGNKDGPEISDSQMNMVLHVQLPGKLIKLEQEE